jgi:hypothetical protein
MHNEISDYLRMIDDADNAHSPTSRAAYADALILAIRDYFTDDELIELVQANAEGRLVVLSTPMIPLVASDDPMDSDVYCPACGVSVSGGWPDYYPDLEWKMCQCPHCGQSVDDTKVITREAAEKALGGGENV